jgi:hypothetical protein
MSARTEPFVLAMQLMMDFNQIHVIRQWGSFLLSAAYDMVLPLADRHRYERLLTTLMYSEKSVPSLKDAAKDIFAALPVDEDQATAENSDAPPVLLPVVPQSVPPGLPHAQQASVTEAAKNLVTTLPVDEEQAAAENSDAPPALPAVAPAQSTASEQPHAQEASTDVPIVGSRADEGSLSATEAAEDPVAALPVDEGQAVAENSDVPSVIPPVAPAQSVPSGQPNTQEVPTAAPVVGSESGKGSLSVTEADAVIARDKAPTGKPQKPWKPEKETRHVIKLMKQGLSNDEIAEQKDVKVSKSAVNLRKIRERARDNGYLPPLEDDKRDTP